MHSFGVRAQVTHALVCAVSALIVGCTNQRNGEASPRDNTGASRRLELPAGVRPLGDSGFDTRSGLPRRVEHISTGIVLVLIPAGEFLCGEVTDESELGYGEEAIVRRVRISKAFYLGVTEVTQEQWTTTMRRNPSWFKRGPSYPVESVTYLQVERFCSRTGLRLPTESEWEYAARAGSSGDVYGPVRQVAWTQDDVIARSQTTERPAGDERGRWWDGAFPVGKKRANAWNLYDMLGNVEEYTADFGYERRPSTEPLVDPHNAERSDSVVVRGCSIAVLAEHVTVWKRDLVSTDRKQDYRGFRVAMTIVE